MAITLYGIPNCDQVKRARTWLDSHAIPYDFHDFKKLGAPRALVERWLTDIPWDTLINRKGTTWRGLSDTRKQSIVDAATAIELITESPSLIKRPVLEHEQAIHVA